MTIEPLEKQSTFSSLQALLATYSDYETWRVGVSQESPVEQLQIQINNPDFPEEPIFLQLLFINDVLEDVGIAHVEELSWNLQIFSELPHEIKSDRMPQITEFLTTLNHKIPLGSFGMTPTGGIYFRYCLLTENRLPDGQLLSTLLENIEKILLLACHLLRTSVPRDTLAQETDNHIFVRRELPEAKDRYLFTGKSYAFLKPIGYYFLIGLFAGLCSLPGLLQNNGWLALLGAGIGSAASSLLIIGRQREKEQTFSLRQQYHALSAQHQIQMHEYRHRQNALQQSVETQARMTEKIKTISNRTPESPVDILRYRQLLQSMRDLLAYFNEQEKKLTHDVEIGMNTLKAMETNLEQMSAIVSKNESPIEQYDFHLSYLQALLEQVGYENSMIKKDNIPYILAHLDRKKIFRVSVRQVSGLSHQLPTYEFLIVWLNIPPTKRMDIAQLSMVCNRMVPVGELVCSPDNQLYFRYNLVVPDGYLSPTMMVEVVETLAGFQKYIKGYVDSLASGRKDLPMVLQQLEQEHGQIDPAPNSSQSGVPDSEEDSDQKQEH